MGLTHQWSCELKTLKVENPCSGVGTPSKNVVGPTAKGASKLESVLSLSGGIPSVGGTNFQRRKDDAHTSMQWNILY